MSDETATFSGPGRPRSEKTRLAILDATWNILMTNGFADLTIEAIAARARVSKATIYKWWASRGVVAVDAYFHRFPETTAIPDSGDTVVDITTLVLRLLEVIQGRAGDVMTELLGQAQFDPALSDILQERWLQPRRALSSAVLRRGIERGEIRSDVTVPIALDEIYGPVLYRLMMRHESLSDDFARELVKNVLRGVAN